MKAKGKVDVVRKELKKKAKHGRGGWFYLNSQNTSYLSSVISQDTVVSLSHDTTMKGKGMRVSEVRGGSPPAGVD